jgi:hypothetical protein
MLSLPALQLNLILREDLPPRPQRLLRKSRGASRRIQSHEKLNSMAKFWGGYGRFRPAR